MIRFLLSGLPRNSFLLLRWLLPDLAIVLLSDLAVFQRTWSRRILLVKPSNVFIFRGSWVLCFASETDMVWWLASHLIAGISCFDWLKSWHFIPFPGAAYLLPTSRVWCALASLKVSIVRFSLSEPLSARLRLFQDMLWFSPWGSFQSCKPRFTTLMIKNSSLFFVWN